MDPTPAHDAPLPSADIVDFDGALLDACPPIERAELMAEAVLLAGAFAPEGRTEEIQALARALQSGLRDVDYGRAHAVRLAAALRRLAVSPDVGCPHA